MVRSPGKPKKRAPKEERLVIREDRAAHPRLLKPTQTKALKAKFDAVHENGMDALKRGDFDRFGTAIKRERKIIERMISKPASPPKRGK